MKTKYLLCFLSFFLISQINLRGQTLVPVGSGIPSGYGIYNGTVTYNNEIYAADVGNIYKWDGSSWSSLSVTVDFPIICMEVYNNELYVGGWFEHFNGNVANRIVKYNGTTWQAVGTGLLIPASSTGGAERMIVSNNSLIVVGGCIQAGSIPVNYVAKWDGTNWSALGNGLPGLASIPGLCIFNNDLIVCSEYLNTFPVYYVMKWDGTVWNQLGSGQLSHWPISCTEYNNELYVGQWISEGDSSSTLVKWNNTNWVNVESNLSDTSWTIPMTLYAYNGCLYLAGQYSNINGVPVNNLSRFDGNSWHTVSNGINGTGNFFTELNNELYLTGEFDSTGSTGAINVVKFVSPPICATVINENVQQGNNISIYPNPFTDKINITTERNEVVEVNLFDVTARKLLQQTFTNAVTLNTAQLAKGIYIYEVRNKEGVVKKGKVVKE